MLRDWRAALGEGSDLLLGALGFKCVEMLTLAERWLKQSQASAHLIMLYSLIFRLMRS